MQVFLIVLDSVGIGEAPDAADYGDVGAATLQHTAASRDAGLRVPHLTAMGLGSIPPLLPHPASIQGVPPVQAPTAAFGALQEVSRGKDTTTGHWEIAGIELTEGLHLFPAGPPSFPAELLDSLSQQTGRRILGNCAASGTTIMAELGEQHMRSGDWIVYTSADSVMQIAAHEDVVPVDELYAGCRIARDLCDTLHVGRVIARPFVGQPGSFTRTERRRDFSLSPPEPTILDRLKDAGHRVVTVGKLDDIFAHRGLTKAMHVETNAAAETAMMTLAEDAEDGFVFANFIDFDMLYGHRRDPAGYATCLENTDAFLGRFLAAIQPDDWVMITADHGNDPTFSGTDHTREYVPLLVHGPGQAGRNLGVRAGFFDIAQSIAHLYGLPALPRGKSFIDGPRAVRPS